MAKYSTDVLIIGGGLAGLCAAISAASDFSRVMIVTKTLVGGANTTSMAAGILSAVSPDGDPGDSIRLHLDDTLRGGAHLNDRILAEVMVKDIPKYFNRLRKLGVEFVEDNGKPRASFIAGHSKPRSYFMKGKALHLQEALKGAAAAGGVEFLERTLITHLVKEGERVVGAVGYNGSEIVAIKAGATIIATGGPGELYSRTLMPAGSTGYGSSLGFRAGVELIDMEFVQFYPTMVWEGGLPKIFIEYTSLLKHGGDVLDADGQSIFRKEGIDEPWKLTRDAFSILIAKSMLRGGGEKPAYMDCTRISGGDMDSDPILASNVKDLEGKGVPVRERKFGVSPYAHFMMGGLRAGLNGETSVPGLFVAGEAAGGIHGANRIGGNAFAACIVFGFRSGLAASLYCSTVGDPAGDPFSAAATLLSAAIGRDGGKDASDVKSRVRELMWQKVGILREKKGLEEALMELNSLRNVPLSSKNPMDKLLVPMMLDTAEAVTLASSIREESRGSHYRIDFPDQKAEWLKKISLSLSEGECKVKFLPL